MRITGLLLSAIAAGGLTLTACTASNDAAQATQPTSTPGGTPAATTTTSTTTKPAEGNVVGPDGYGKVKLGMSYAAAKATGAIKESEKSEPGCSAYELIIGGVSDGYLGISKARGVETIGPVLKASTPEGVSVGTTVAKVKTAYPSLDDGVLKELGHTLVAVPGNSKAQYRLGFKNGKVEMISLQREDQSCYE
jgi:hypothetical protein